MINKHLLQYCQLGSLLCVLGVVPGTQAAQGVLSITEGTNIAVTANPKTQDLILALQGGLYLLAENTDAATPLLLQEDAWEADIANDGKKLVYQGYREGSWDLWELQLDEPGDPLQLTQGLFDDREPNYSPDGSKVVFSSDRSGNYDLWQLTLATGELVQLTDSPENESSPSWSPDSGAIAYVQNRGRNYVIVVQVEGMTEAVDVYNSNVPVSGLQWTPNELQLSFRTLDRDETGNAHTSLRVLEIASGKLQVISEPNADVFPFRGSWLNADTLVYSADGGIQKWQRDAGNRTIEFKIERQYTQRDYPQKQRNFDNPAARQVLGISQPALSPDGSQIAFTAIGDLWLWEPATRTLLQLTDDAAADQMPAWTADGQSINYVSDLGGHYQVFQRDVAGGVSTTLPLNAKELSFPRLSPDGKKLAYFTDVPGNPLLHVEGQLTITSLEDGSSKALLAPMPPQPLNWSADSQHVLTTRLQPYSTRYREGLYVLVSVNVATGAATNQVPYAHRSISNASLASEAMQVVYTQDGVLNRWQLDEKLQGHAEPEVLVDALADSPSVSADGRYVVYQAGDKLLRLSTASGEVEDITPTLNWQPALSTETWVLRAGRLFDGLSDSWRENVSILIKGNRIAAIDNFDIPEGARIVDYSDKAVVPGLIESHAHIGDHNQSESQGRAWLSYGITSVRDPGSNPYLANERKEAWQGGRRPGPRLFITGHNIDGNRLYYAVSEGISSDAHLERALERSRLLEVDFFKTYVRLPDRQQRRVIEFAHSLGVPVTSHEILPAAINGVDNIEHFTGTSRRGYTTKISELGRSYQDVSETLTKTAMGIVPTMVVPGVVLTFSEQNDIYNTRQFNTFYGIESKQNYQDFMGFFGPGSEGFVDAYGGLLSTLIEAGAIVGTGTDSPFTPFGTGLHAEFRLYQREGLAPWQILQAATRGSAVIAGAANDLGTIEAGKLADMVVIDGDPLNDIGDLDHVVMTILGGKRYLLTELLETPR